MNKLLSILFLMFCASGFSQIAPDVYLIQFTDKQNNPYSIHEPREFLSQRAIERRERFNIPINEQDLPVNPEYLEGLRKFGTNVYNVSRWFNSVNIKTSDTAVLDSIRSLPYVRSVKCSGNSIRKKYYSDKLSIASVKSEMDSEQMPDTSYYNYGGSGRQIGMLNGHFLHNQGFHGEDMVIAVLDGGFTDVDINPAFDSLWSNNQILGTWDFVTRSPLGFDKHKHGSQVLSIMGANLPGKFIGSAPKAGYYLLRTENAVSEYPEEEENWISAAEFADSAGVDLINSSLSYTVFNDSTMNHRIEDLDGNTTRITRAADIAASKGILVVASAGNKGAADWHFIGAPADADSILTVGAVDSLGDYAYFSSVGRELNGKIKPNLTAQGLGTSFAGSNGDVFRGNGTSFSAPIICGLAACLWQSRKSVSNFDLIQRMQETASQALNPDPYYGYGLPDLSKAFFILQGIDSKEINKSSFVRIFPNPFISSFTLDYKSPVAEALNIEIWDLNGRLVFSKTHDSGFQSFNRINLSGLDFLSPGIFILRIIAGEDISQMRIVKFESGK